MHRFAGTGRMVRRAARGVVMLGLSACMLAGAWQDVSAAPIRRLGQNPRALALGNTGVSYADDEMALLYNPAGLGSVENFWAEILPIAVEGSDAGRDLLDSAGGSSFSDASAFIDTYTGREVQLRGFFYPHVIGSINPGFTLGFGYLLEIQTEILIEEQADSTLQAEALYREDRGSVIGLSFPLFEGGLLLGFSVRQIDRINTEGTLSSADLAAAAASGTLDIEALLGSEEGSATGYDFGLIWRIESFSSLRAQFGLAVSNVGGTTFSPANSTATAPAEIPQEISYGWSMRPDIIKAVPIMFSLEMRDSTKELTTDNDTGKRTHIGLEVGFLPLDKSTNMFTVRAGYNGGSTSFGAEFSLWHSFTVQYVVYYTEFGDKAGDDSRKRQILQFNLIGF